VAPAEAAGSGSAEQGRGHGRHDDVDHTLMRGSKPHDRDASRSCLGLETCVGSSTRQIVVARVLLTAAAPPALPGSSMLGGSRAPPCSATRVSCAQPAAGDTCRAMAQMKPASSRAIAAVMTLAGLPLRASLR